MSFPIVLDLETQKSFYEVGYNPKKLKVSVVGIYDYATDEYRIYREEKLSELFHRLENASLIIGFNIDKFDLLVLEPYYVGSITQFKTLDILVEVEKALGHRLALDDLVKTTLNLHKSGHGLLALEYFAKGEWEKLEKYCLDDVRITRKLYEFGKREKKLLYNTHKGITEFPVTFDVENTSQAVSLSLPF
ncbi:ribonuclease H-like domain-containing protein [Candidatus Gottesmanbacteria bacterium]|nr:ribonuclease H-like domain-containing protein [Candidatus Gottesmanbacteria bacterium]